MKNLALPKIKIKPFVVLMAILGVVVIAEIFVLYKYLYLSLASKSNTPDQNQEQPRPKIDLPAYEKLRTWQAETAVYTGSGYKLESSTQGRNNPFAEY